MSTFINTLLAHAEMSGIYNMSPEELMITLSLAACTDEPLRKELIKARSGTMTELRQAVNRYETEINTVRRLTGEARALATTTNKTPKAGKPEKKPSKPTICYRCGEGHKVHECKKNKESLKCGKCNRIGHIEKVCRSGTPRRNNANARQTTAEEEETNSRPSSPDEYANAARVDNATPPLLL